MPDIVSKIPIGFNLDGYDFLNSASADTSSSTYGTNETFGGVDAAWDGGLVDDRWVADDTLKQVEVQVSCYQAAPLQYSSSDGKNYYGEVTDKIDDHSYAGGAAYSGNGEGLIGGVLTPNDINDCRGGQLSGRLSLWANNINMSESGRKEFFCGAAICPDTLVHYLNHFYNINVDKSKVKTLLTRRVVCAEIVFNLTGTSGKAFRVRIVDTPGDRGYKGGPDNVKGMHYEYDGFDIMIALLLTNTFSEVCTYKSKQLNEVVNSGNLKFPWASSGYNYKKAMIYGYGPEGIAKLGLVYESKPGLKIPGSYAVWQTKVLTSNGLPRARIRFFTDLENKGTALGAIPNLPDEFFKTNYADGATTQIRVVADYTGTTFTKNFDHYLNKPIQISKLNYHSPVPPHFDLKAYSAEYFKYSVNQSAFANNMVLYDLPGPIINANPTSTVPGLKAPGNKKVYIHKNMVDRLDAVFRDTINHYGDRLTTDAPLLCKITSSLRQQSSNSRHTYGLAFDFNGDSKEGYNYADFRAPLHQQCTSILDGKGGLKSHIGSYVNGRPTLIQPQYWAFFQIANAHGFESLGLYAGNDYMHFQFATYPFQQWNYLLEKK